MQLSVETQALLTSDFIQRYWQTQPLFFKQCFADNAAFAHSIDIDELAGLALEEEIESRLIQQTDAKALTFSLEQGPFTEEHLTALPASDWTLLIQAVDHYLDDFQCLKQQFNFIPQWRLDDVMISISPEGGTVGPHFDQYDVFLIQASGTRTWQIGQHCDANTETVKNSPLSLIKAFKQQSSHHCEPGDMLYIPPGHAHWGTASSDNCVTISIGFRAASYQDIIDELCMEANSRLSAADRLCDQQHDLCPDNGALISSHCINSLSANIHQLLLDPLQLTERFNALSSSTKYHSQLEPITPAQAQETLNTWQQQPCLIRLCADSRINYSVHPSDKQRLIVGINGEVEHLPNSESLLQLIIQLTAFDSIQLDLGALNSGCQQLILLAISLHALDEEEL